MDWLRLRPRAQGVAQILRALPRAYRLVVDAAPRQTRWLIAVTVLSGVIPIALLAATKPAVDAVAHLVRSAGGDWTQAVLMVGIVAALLVVSEAIAGLSAWLRIGQSERVAIHVRGLVHRQSARVAMSFYEQPDYFDRLHRARDEAADRPVQLIDSGTELVRTAIALIGVGAILAAYSLWLPLFLLLAMLPSLASTLVHSWRNHRFHLATTVEERHAYYFDWLLTERSAAAEMRSHGLSEHFSARYREQREKIRIALLKLRGRESLAQFGFALLGLFAAGAAVLWMLHSAAEGRASLGDVALCYQAFVQGGALTRSAVNSLGSAYRNSLFLSDFFGFLALPGDALESPATGAPDPTTPIRTRGAGAAPGIRFEQVTFSYPGYRRPALQSLDLAFEAGRITAVLGPNGAGKSTLIKLLCRFYDPDSGRVLLDGQDLRMLELPALRDTISVLFQDSLQFSGTLEENVLPLPPRDADRLDRALAAAQAGPLVAGLPDGLQTRLAAWFPGGTDLSGGEWQRIAMARSFARAAPILVLDEPTSAMDPWAERQWLSNLRTHCDGRTVILITHRLTTAAAADAIHVMGEGRLLESGTHRVLRAAGGPYAKLWERVATSEERDP